MLVFVDESGDPGRKLDKGSSRYFTVAMVTFEDYDEALACDQRISLLRRELRVTERFEFHFRDNSHRVRLAFLEAVAPYEFFYHGFVLNKGPDLLFGKGFNLKDSLYKYVCGLVFESAKPYLRDAIVVIDGSGDRPFQAQLAFYLRRRLKEGDQRLIRTVKAERSRSNNLLQLADYVAGIISRRTLQKRGADEYRRYIASRELGVHIWPK